MAMNERNHDWAAMMNKKRAATTLLSLIAIMPAVAMCEKLRDRWSFSWDHHLQASEISRFELEIKFSSSSIKLPIDGGSTTAITDVLIDEEFRGDGIAVLRACRSNGECSPDSNSVIVDRSAPLPATNLSFSDKE